MMEAAVKGLTREDGTRPILMAVTQLTSTGEERMKEESARKQAKEIAKINESNVEKATLGDLDVLQSLKEDLEKEGK